MLDLGSEQEHSSQFNTSHLCPAILRMLLLMRWWHHCHCHLSTLPLWTQVSCCQVIWAPCSGRCSPGTTLRPAARARPVKPEDLLQVFPGAFHLEHRGVKPARGRAHSCAPRSLQRGVGCRHWACPEPQLLPALPGLEGSHRRCGSLPRGES